LNPAHPSLQFHKLDKPRDKRFWSIRVSSDIRLIVHRSEDSLLLCYVAHHDDAYNWAERQKLETHPKTGAAQFVEIRETVQEIAIPKYVEVLRPKPLLFDYISDDVLLGYGIPAEWLKDVRAANEDTVLELAGHLPAEAAEALLELATGTTPVPIALPVVPASPFEHPDALRRFRVITKRRRAGAGPQLPMGQMDRISASCAEAVGAAQLCRPGARVGLRGYRKDDCGLAPGGLSRARKSGFPRAPDNVFRYVGKRPSGQIAQAYQQRASAWGTAGSTFDNRDRPASV
jgi:hypothetical protein